MSYYQFLDQATRLISELGEDSGAGLLRSLFDNIRDLGDELFTLRDQPQRREAVVTVLQKYLELVQALKDANEYAGRLNEQSQDQLYRAVRDSMSVGSDLVSSLERNQPGQDILIGFLKELIEESTPAPQEPRQLAA